MATNYYDERQQQPGYYNVPKAPQLMTAQGTPYSVNAAQDAYKFFPKTADNQLATEQLTPKQQLGKVIANTGQVFQQGTTALKNTVAAPFISAGNSVGNWWNGSPPTLGISQQNQATKQVAQTKPVGNAVIPKVAERGVVTGQDNTEQPSNQQQNLQNSIMQAAQNQANAINQPPRLGLERRPEDGLIWGANDPNSMNNQTDNYKLARLASIANEYDPSVANTMMSVLGHSWAQNAQGKQQELPNLMNAAQMFTPPNAEKDYRKTFIPVEDKQYNPDTGLPVSSQQRLFNAQTQQFIDNQQPAKNTAQKQAELAALYQRMMTEGNPTERDHARKWLESNGVIKSGN